MKQPLSDLTKMRLAAIPLIIATIVCLFVPLKYAPLILALPAGVWVYFAEKRYSCPRCHKVTRAFRTCFIKADCSLTLR